MLIKQKSKKILTRYSLQSETNPQTHVNKESSNQKHNSKTKKNISLRSDVVNKTLVRSIKRYYTSLFFSKVPQSSLKHNFSSNIKSFTESIYKNCPLLQNPKFAHITLSDLCFYLSMFINPNYIK
jgi:hypothetical protein